MTRKIITVPLILILTAAVLSGCKPTDTPASDAAGSIVTPPGTFPVVNLPITLKVFAQGSASIENFETNDFTKFYEEKTGIKLEWTIAPPASITELRRLSLASNDLPDFYMNAGFTKDDEVLYGSGGVLIPLNNLIDTHGHWMKEMFSDLPETRAMLTTPDGNIYSLPYATDGLQPLYSSKLYLNMEWLNNLGLEIPSTTAEYAEVLRAFKTRDPNANGKADEKPLIGYQPTGPGINEILPFFVNSFIQMDLQGFFVTAGNKVDVAYNKNEFRDALAYLAGLVSEGLLDPSTFSMSTAELRQLAENPEAQIIGSTVSLSPTGFYAMSSKRQEKFDAIPPLEGPRGTRLALFNPTAQVSTGLLTITKACKYPEAVIRWVDWFFDQEGLMTMRIGREGIEWDWAAPGDLSYTGAPALWINIGAQGGSTNAFWMQYGVASYNRHSKQKGIFGENLYGPEGLNSRLYIYTKESYEPYKPQKYLPPMYFESDVLSPVVQNINDLISYRNQTWARFITGDLTLNDQNWNTYLRTLESMNLPAVVDAYQKTYDAYLRNAQ